MHARFSAFPRPLTLLLATALTLALAGCGRDPDAAQSATMSGSSASKASGGPARIKVDLARTTHGVPHVRASDFRSLAYGLAYAYAQDNVCMFADSVLTVRGERSRFFGAEARPRQRTGDEYGGGSGFMDLKNEDSDFFFKGYLDLDQLRAGYAAGPAEPRQLLEGFVEGYNRYLKDNGSKLPAACAGQKWVKPISFDDMVLVVAEKALHASGQVFAADFVAAGRVPGAPVSLAKLAPRKLDTRTLVAQLDKLNKQGIGSNALAVGKDLSSNGRGLLLGNPHFPWTTSDRFYQAHLTVPGRYDAMGVIIGGVPAVVIGFNRDVAWSHTVTTAYHFTTFRLALDAGDPTGTTYLYDGARRKMTSKTVTVEALQPDGSLAQRSKTFYFSHQGAVIVRPEAGMTWSAGAAFVLADPNRDLAWSHTVTTAYHFTTFRLALDAGDPTGTTYLYDGARRKMTSKTVTVEALQPDGSLAQRSKTFYFSHQGAVIVRPEAGMTWSAGAAFVLADPNRNNTRMLEQWLGIGAAGNVRELKASLDKVVGLPWVNTVAADRDGNTLYADASVVPHMNTDKFINGCLLLEAALLFDGSRSSCAWGQDQGAPSGIYSPANAPWMMRTDYVGNSNDSYWLTNPKSLLVGPAPFGYSPLYGSVGVEQSLRTRLGFRQLDELIGQKKKLALTDIQALAYSNRVHAAELVLPELLKACAGAGDALARQACMTLQAWDRRADTGSRGAVLFREFWSIASTIPNKWATPFDPADPVNTPHGVAPAAMPAMLAALRSAAGKLESLGVPLDGRLGDYQFEPRNGVRIPLHGGNGDQEGTYSSLTMATELTPHGYVGVYWGQSYIQTVSFDDKGPVAQAVLTYGQSTDPTSPWYADQTQVYSRKGWPLLPFTPERIKADPNYTTVTLRE